MRNVVALLLVGVVATGAQESSVALEGPGNFVCPHEFGFYAHELSCDKYYSCEAGVPTLKVCGNGLAFDNSDPENLRENCDYSHNVDCGLRTQLEPPISTPHCPNLYGIFADPDDCSVFWSCWDGEASRYACAPGLAYDRKSRVCNWMDNIPECKQQRDAMQQDFVCPAPGELVATGSFSRHPHPDDCRQYFICIDGVVREYGCPIGTVFQIGDADGLGKCEDPEFVPGCEDYYGDLDLAAIRGSQLLLGNLGLQNAGNAARSRRPSATAAGAAETPAETQA
ncbi:protein obstructor-E isoform X1 [Penaeus vannamei]|uniref:protein obstructor-E isoform X1 n=1 Tax=Penaeus vannamei TaxID=6689 RepID=UPI000F6821F4|nr:protein obstructor-E-like isoform X2 [Penaeus vannamei]